MKKYFVFVFVVLFAFAGFAFADQIPADKRAEKAAKYLDRVDCARVISTVERAVNELDEEFLVYTEDFTDFDDWTIEDNLVDGFTWHQSPHPSRLFDYLEDTAPFMYVDSDDEGNGIWMIESLISPSFDLSGYVDARLTFDSYYNWIGADVAKVEASTDGVNWTTVAEYNTDHLGEQSVILTDFAGESEVYLRFFYDDGNVWAWYWAIDNINVYGSDELYGDINAPDIAYAWGPWSVTTGNDIVVDAGVTDETGVNEVTLHYFQWDEINWIPVPDGITGSVAMTEGEPGVYQGSIPGDLWTGDDAVAWYVYANDAAGNEALNPVDAPDNSYLTYVDDDLWEPSLWTVSAPEWVFSGDDITITQYSWDDSGISSIMLYWMEWDPITMAPVPDGIEGTVEMILTEVPDNFEGTIVGAVPAEGNQIAWYCESYDGWDPANMARNPWGEDTYYFVDVVEPVTLPPDLVYFDDFEENDGSWIATNDFPADPIIWQWGDPSGMLENAFSPANCWATIIDGNYPNGMWPDYVAAHLTMAEPVVLPDDAMVTYYHWVDCENNYDGYNLQISTDGGATWMIVDPWFGYNDSDVWGMNDEPGFNGHEATWVQVHFDLSAYAGLETLIRFRFGSDTSVTYWGFGIDDFSIYGTAGAADLILTATPWNDPAWVGQGGGVFRWDAYVENVSGDIVTFDAWTGLTLPDGTPYAPLDLFTGLTLLDGAVLMASPAQAVPGFAPGGVYTYHAYVGDYMAGDVIAEATFEFAKLPLPGAAAAPMTSSNGWVLTDFFELDELTTPEVSNNIPSEYALNEAYPNPFNPTTTISISLPEVSNLQVTVFNTVGQQVGVLANGYVDAGYHSLTFDANGLASGIYFIQAVVPGKMNEMRKVVLMR